MPPGQDFGAVWERYFFVFCFDVVVFVVFFKMIFVVVQGLGVVLGWFDVF